MEYGLGHDVKTRWWCGVMVIDIHPCPFHQCGHHLNSSDILLTSATSHQKVSRCQPKNRPPYPHAASPAVSVGYCPSSLIPSLTPPHRDYEGDLIRYSSACIKLTYAPTVSQISTKATRWGSSKSSMDCEPTCPTRTLPLTLAGNRM